MFDVIPTNGQTWLICGGREFDNGDLLYAAMGDLIRLRGMPDSIVHGDALGADQLAHGWALLHGLTIHAVRADWRRDGRAAGPIRNQEMLDRYGPQFVVAFPGGKGTADMVRRARAAGIDVAEIRLETPNE